MKRTRLFHSSGINLIFALIFFFLFTTLECDEDKCVKTIAPEYEFGMRAEVLVKDKDDNPLSGINVRVEIQKTHCGGRLGPLLAYEGPTMSDGIFAPPLTWTFKMNNKEDYITSRIIVYGFTSHTFSNTFSYDYYKKYAGNIYTHSETCVLE